MNPLKPIRKLFSFLKKLFLNGLFTLLPITATIFFVSFTFNLIIRWLEPLRLIEPEYLQRIPGSEFVLVVLFIMLIGLLLKIFIIGPLMHYFEKLIAKIPFIRTVYSASKTVVDFFNVPDKSTIEKKVVMLEFPRKNSYVIGFLLESAQDNFQKLIPEEKRASTEYVKVFLPSSPAPTTGYFFIVPREDIIETNISFEEAIKTVVSCGLITPESVKAFSKNK